MIERYSRQTLFPPIGEDGQSKLQEKHVLIIGVGALGTQSAEMLTRAGIGTLTIVDRDYIEWSNLQRQYLFTEEDAEKQLPKAIAAKEKLEKINRNVDIRAHVMDVTPTELDCLTEEVHLILDATDNFDIRMMINDISQKKKIPWIYGSCVGSYGISLTILPGKTPCLQCLLGSIPMGGETCDTAGIIQPAAAQVVIHQTTEALKLLTEDVANLRDTLLSFDLWKNELTEMKIVSLKKDDCPSCSEHATYPYLHFDEQTKAAVLCGRESVQIRPPTLQQRNLKQTAQKLEQIGGKVERNAFLLSFSLHDARMVLFKDGRALIHGTNDIDYAKTLYHRYLS